MALVTVWSLVLLSATSATADIFPDCQNGPLASNGICDVNLSPEQRAQALIKILSVPEKINLTGSNSPGVPRLGLFPYTWWNEALHGVASSPGVNFSMESGSDYSYATSFPEPILMSAAFDDALIGDVASVVSTEARAFNNANRSGLDYWTPNINPFKDPRWGRGQETPGEDTFHIMSYIKSLIPGLQGGEDPSIRKVIATCKHFVGYDLESYLGINRNTFDAQISTQDLAEFYMQPFQACARDSNVGSIMCSYNAVNGRPTCADDYILQDVLRNHWGWTSEQQYVTSDCDAVQNIYMPHNYSPTPAAAAAAALNAGTDLDCGDYYQIHLPDAYSQGLFNESTLDTTLTRLYSSLVRVGYFNSASATPYRSYDFMNVSTPFAQALALKAAEEGITLLKNDGTLPLKLGARADGSNMTLGLFGGFSDATTTLLANYAGTPSYTHSIIYAAQQIPGVSVVNSTAPGGQGNPTTDAWNDALQKAEQADVIIIAEGIDDSVEAEGMDRYRIDWTGAQVDLINQYASLGKPTVLVQMGGGQLDDTPFLNNPNISAIVWGGYPGQDGGTAIMNVLTGQAAPAGRLPVTQYPQAYVQQVNMTDMALRPNPSIGFPGRTYKWYNDAVLPFGFGLSYTTFDVTAGTNSLKNASKELSSLTNGCSEKYLDNCPLTTVPVNVKNIGNVTSDYSALMFLSGDFGPQPQPYKSLVAYARAHDLQPGQTQMLLLNLTVGSLTRRDVNGNAIVYPGSYDFGIDVNQDGSVKYQLGSFELTGQQLTVENWPQPPAPASTDTGH